MRSKRSPQDFRHAAEMASTPVGTYLETALTAWDSGASLCAKLKGDATPKLYRIAIVPFVWLGAALLILLAGLICGALILTPWLNASLWSLTLAIGGPIIGIVLVFMSGGVGEGIFEGVLSARLGDRLRLLDERVTKRYPFAIEDPATYKKQKIISEDYATGGLDRVHQGLLLEGLQYRYIVRPADVIEVVEDEDYLLISYRVGNAMLKMAVTILLSGEDSEEARIRAAIKKSLTNDATPA